MGKSPRRKLSDREKEAIRQARHKLGAADNHVLTHNRDGVESPWEPLYRAWVVWVPVEGQPPRGRPVNWDRVLPGGVTIGQVLTLAFTFLQ